MTEKIEKLAKVKAIVAFREKHFKTEMETNLKVAQSVRDSKTAKDKDRIDAIKTIARMVGGLQPERATTQAPTKGEQQATRELTTDENKRLDELLNGKH